MKKSNLIIGLFIVLLAFSCNSNKKVTRVDDKQMIDLSGRWNDTDSRLVSEEMIKDALSRPWISEFTTEKGKKPTVIVGTVKNKSSEHINTETFINDIEREFINSGKVKVVQSADLREEIRKERTDQQGFSSPETVKKWGLEKGADYILQGTVNSISDEDSKLKLMYYQIDIELSDIETNEKVWIGTKKIKKVIK